MAIWGSGGGGLLGGMGRRRPQTYEEQVGAATEALPGRAGAIRDYIMALERESPRGIQSQTPGLAAGAAGTLMGGMTPAEQEAQVAGQRQEINSLLGGLAGGGGSDALLASEGVGALTRSQGRIQAERDAAIRGGAGQVFGGLSSSLLGEDPLATSFGQMIADSQRHYGPRRWFSR
jgi:hypothetical protein